MRIVSLLPSTTEILFAIGAGQEVVGVSFECDFPTEARNRTIVSTSAMPAGLSSEEIDRFVVEATRRGEDLYHLDEGALRDLDADLVVTQDLCAVCAVDVSVVDDALAHLGCTADVLSIDPHTLEEVLDSIETLARAAHKDATELVASLTRRLQVVENAVAGKARPAVMLLEWTDPPYAPGHWVPEMIARAGGTPVLGRAGEKSVRVTWEAVRAAAPDLVVAAPCGFDLEAAAGLTQSLVEKGELPGGVPVWAVDANAAYARPGPRLVDGVETLAAILHGPAGAPIQGARRIR